MTNRVIVGIDPGLHGAFAFLDIDNCRMRIIDMPVVEFFSSGKNRSFINPQAVSSILGWTNVSSACIEDVYSSSQMGVVSAFNFGYGKGILLGVCAALNISVSPVTPAKWKKDMRMPKDKRASVLRASQLFPGVAKQFQGPRGGVYDGRAEAAVLALYGAIELGWTPVKAVEEWKDTE